MKRTIRIEDEKGLGRALLFFVAGMIGAYTLFLLLSLLFFVLVHLLFYGDINSDQHLFPHDFDLALKVPFHFLDYYKGWWNVLQSSWENKSFSVVLLLPFLAPILFIAILLMLFVRSSYSFGLWYMLKHRFANMVDISKMGLIDGSLLVLGRFGGSLLGLPQPSSVLCLGETGSGKTSTVAVPSILRSDDMSVVAVDNSGTLARHTSGYRATLGPVFYFNWDLSEDYDKKIFYPRWNPLGEGNLPPKGKNRDDYISFLASYLVSSEVKIDKENYWDWLASATMCSLMSFLIVKYEQAVANDYFLSKILEKRRLTKEDKDILLSYYALMPAKYSKDAVEKITNDTLTAEDYLPIGSWAGIPASWQGKEICFGMFTDWLLENYLSSKDEQGDWLSWIEQLLIEVRLFGYGNFITKGLQQFMYISKLQRQLIFAYVLKPLRMFINHTIRERTSGSDFYMKDLLGVEDKREKSWHPITIYAAANTKTSKFMNRMFVEVLLRNGVLKKKDMQKQMLMVFDDAGQMLRVRGMLDSVAKAPSKNVSVMLLCNSLNNMENTYGRETLEKLVSNTSYKIVMADNNEKLSKQLDKMAIFATRSVQIPKDDRKTYVSASRVADANYFHRLAQDLKLKKNLNVETRGYQLLMVEGFYHCPVLTQNKTFMKDELFREKANLPISYFLDAEIVNKRSVQDIKIPRVEEVLMDVDLGIDDEIELNQYMNVVYNEVKSKVSDDVKIETVLINDISEKWKKRGQFETIKAVANYDNWWMNETAFELVEDENKDNPFDVKK